MADVNLEDEEFRRKVHYLHDLMMNKQLYIELPETILGKLIAFLSQYVQSNPVNADISLKDPPVFDVSVFNSMVRLSSFANIDFPPNANSIPPKSFEWADRYLQLRLLYFLIQKEKIYLPLDQNHFLPLTKREIDKTLRYILAMIPRQSRGDIDNHPGDLTLINLSLLNSITREAIDKYLAVDHVVNVRDSLSDIPPNEIMLTTMATILGNEVNICHMSNIYEINPEEISADYGSSSTNEWYFYTYRGIDHSYEPVLKRPVGDGYWILLEEYNIHDKCFGSQKFFQYYTGNHPDGDKTSWCMIEYRINPLLRSTFWHYGRLRFEVFYWVLCKICKNCMPIPVQGAPLPGKGRDRVLRQKERVNYSETSRKTKKRA